MEQSSSSVSKPKVALISRFTVSDFPFYAGWLEHYANNIEIDHFYLFFIHHDKDAWNNIYKADFEEIIMKDCPTYHRLISEGRITFINGYRAYSDPNHFIQIIFPVGLKSEDVVKFYLAMKNNFDFVLHIDSDEFLYLGKGNTVHEFIRKVNLKYTTNGSPVPNYFFFRWLMVPSRECYVEDYVKTLSDQRNPKYFVNHGKSMASTKYIDWKKTHCHHFYFLASEKSKKVVFDSNKEDVLVEDICETTFLIHFSYRGIYDCLNKMRFQCLNERMTNNYFKKEMIFNIFDRNIHNFRSDLFHHRIIVYLGELNCSEHVPQLATMIDKGFGINGRRFISGFNNNENNKIDKVNDILELSNGISAQSNIDYLKKISLQRNGIKNRFLDDFEITDDMIDCFVDRIQQIDQMHIFEIEECGKTDIKAFILNSVYNLTSADSVFPLVLRGRSSIKSDIIQSSISQNIQPTVMKEHRNFYLR